MLPRRGKPRKRSAPHLVQPSLRNPPAPYEHLACISGHLTSKAAATAGKLRHSPVLDGWLRCPYALKHVSLLNSLRYINFY